MKIEKSDLKYFAGKESSKVNIFVGVDIFWEIEKRRSKTGQFGTMQFASKLPQPLGLDV